MKKIVKLFVVVLCVCSLNPNISVAAATLPNTEFAASASQQSLPSITAFEDGDVVGFIGDSITHARYCDISYLEIMNQYYLCQFSEKNVEFRNLGVAGYKACDVLDIFESDPGFQDINKAVIMLGTNEAILKYSPEKYIADMDKLISRLKENGLTGEDILLLTPPFCDEKNASGALLKIEKRLLEYLKALETKLPQWEVQYLDIHTPMANFTAKIQQETPTNSLTTDGIHPNQTGQMLIAYYLLAAQDAGNKVVIYQEENSSENNTISPENTAFHRTDKGMFGSFLQETLPFTATKELLEFLSFFEPAASLYQESLQINDLGENTHYQVIINEVTLGTFTGKELSEGINTATLITHPFQPQVQQLLEACQKRHKTAVAYRDIWIDVMMKRVTYTKQQALTKYENWKKKDDVLREEMNTLAQNAVGNNCSLVIVEAGYPVAQLKADYQAALEQAQKDAEAQAQKEALEKAQREAEENAKLQEAIQAAKEAREKAERQAAINTLCVKAFIIMAIVAALSLPFILFRRKR